MSKKNADREKDEEKDLDEEEEDEDEGDDEDEEEEEAPAPAASVKLGAKAGKASGDAPKAKARAHRTHDEDDEDDEEEDSDGEDPYWWTPHAVLSALVLIGVLGFFGVFNKVLAGIAAKPGAHQDKATTAATTSPAPQPGANGNKPPDQRQEYGAKHLLVQYKGSARAAATITRTEDEAKARATEAMKKARSGTKFEDLVKEYSDEPGAAQRGGDLGKFHKGQMVPEFQNAVEKLKVGEVSDLVKTQFGYHVIQRTQ